MLDTDLLLLKSLVPPKHKPPPWMPLRVNRRHPVSRGLRYVHLLNDAKETVNTLGPTNASITSGGIGVTRVGLGLVGTPAAYYGLSSTLDLPPVTGSILIYGTASHSSNDGGQRIIFGTGAAYPGSVGNAGFDFNKYVDNNFYFGWFNGTDHRVVAGAASAYTAGQSLTLGGRWNTTGGTQLFVKGVQLGTNGTLVTAPTQGNFTIGAYGGNNHWVQAAGGGIHYTLIWDRTLTDGEFLLLENDPFCWAEPDMVAPWFIAPAAGVDPFFHKPRFLAHLRR